MLFPEIEGQKMLGLAIRPCGNSIKKAYLSHAQTKQLCEGCIVLFYRSADAHAVTAVGIVEDTLRSRNADEIARYVGQRTVYTFDDIEKLCEKDVLAIRFRLVKLLGDPISLNELKQNKVIKAAPQSITQLKEQGIEWLRQIIEL